MPDQDTARATAREQQQAYMDSLKREQAGYARRTGNDKAHDVTWSERAAEVDAEIKRLEAEMDEREVYSTLGRPEGPHPSESRPEVETTSTEPPERAVPTAPVKRKPRPSGPPSSE